MSVVGTVLSLVWLVLCVWYLVGAVGLTQVGLLLPQELGAFLTGAVLPPLLLWLLIGQRQLARRIGDLEAEVLTEGRRRHAVERDEPRVTRLGRASPLREDDEEAERMPRLKVAHEPDDD